MLSGLSARADLRGRRIDVSWTWSGLGARPRLRLVRRRGAYPADPDDGYGLLDVGRLFQAPSGPWARTARVRYLADRSGREGGLVQATLDFSFGAPGAPVPEVVDIALYDAPSGAVVTARVTEVTRVEPSTPAPGPWDLAEALEIFHTPGGGPEVSGGVVTVFRDHSDAVTASLVRWEPAAGAPVEVEIDTGEVTHILADVERLTPTELVGSWTRVARRDGWELGLALSDPEGADPAILEPDSTLSLREEFSEDTGDWTRTFEVEDRRAVPEETTYYRVFREDPPESEEWGSDREWKARAIATAPYDAPARLYGLLPSVHQYYDEPTAEDRGEGQLRRFLEVFGLCLDHLRSGAESLRTRHDLAAVREDYLPALGEWISWPTDVTAPLATQRSDIRLAPRVFETMGTVPNLVSLAQRVTGWECRAKEFVHNIFLTNAPEYEPVRELWEVVHDGTALGPPLRLTSVADRFDGRPASVVDGAGRSWLFWHSDRSDRWQIWFRRSDGTGTTDPAPLMPPPPDAPAPTHDDLAPAALLFPAAGGDELWLFWQSGREGAVDIWARVHDGTDWGDPFRVTDHRAADRRPSPALDASGSLWVLWESERRGRGEIWARVYDGTAWTPAVRLTGGLGHDHEPAASVDAAGSLWLVWRRDESDRSRLYARVRTGDTWGPATPLEDGPWRDESPTLALRGSDLWLLWHSDRTGRWEVWARVHDGVEWGAPFRITERPEADKEPYAMVDGTDLRIVWRSERANEERRSHTVDTGDTELLRARGRFGDRIHYTYDTQRGDLDWYARDVVGVYAEPPTGTPASKVQDVLDRAATYLEPFRPATVRFALIPDRGPGTLDFPRDGIDVDTPIADAFEDEID